MAGGLKEDYDFSPTSQRIQRVMGLDIATANINIGVDVPPGTVFSHVNPNSQCMESLFRDHLESDSVEKNYGNLLEPETVTSSWIKKAAWCIRIAVCGHQ